MSRSEPAWDVQNSGDYRTYQTGKTAGGLPRVVLLLQVDGSGHAGEGFRFAVEAEKIDADIWTRDLYDPATLAGFRLRYQLNGSEMDIRPNALASKWEDLDSLIGRGQIVVQRPEGGEALNTEFRAHFATEKAKNPNLGASVRWSVQASPHGELRLVLQGLPAAARALRSDAILSSDEVNAITLDTFEAVSNFQPTGLLRGPTPVLFARDPASAAAALETNPSRIHQGEI